MTEDELITKLNSELKNKMQAFEVNHGHDATITLHDDGSGAIGDMWGNEEDFKNIFSFLLG